MSDYFMAGGFGMYPTMLFGFVFLATSALYARRPTSRALRIALTWAALTLGAGALGFVTGVCASARYLEKLPAAEQVGIFALGIEESLHNLVLALVLALVGGLIVAAGAWRAPEAPAPTEA